MDFMLAASKALVASLEEFDRHGIRLTYLPGIKYDDREMRNEHLKFAAAKNEYELVKEVEKELMVACFGYCGIKLSREAVEDPVQMLENDRYTFEKGGETVFKSPIVPDTWHDKIVLYRDFPKKFKKAGEKWALYIMAHKAWHLVDGVHGALMDYPLASENIANYIGARLSGVEPEEDEVIGLDDRQIIALIEKRLQRARNPLKTLLRPKTRKGINELLMKEIIAAIPENVKTEEIEGAEFPDEASFLNYIREMGAIKIANEMKGQDMRKFLEIMNVRITGEDQ